MNNIVLLKLMKKNTNLLRNKIIVGIWRLQLKFQKSNIL